MSIDFRTFRIGVPGPNGHTITAGDWTAQQTETATVKRMARAFNPYPIQNGAIQSTQTHGLGGQATGTLVLGASMGHFTPMFLHEARTWERADIWVVTAQPGSTIRLAVYDAAFTYVGTFGTVTADTTGWKTALLASPWLPLPAGQFWVGPIINNVANVGVRSLVGGFPAFHDPSTMQRYSGFHGPMDVTTPPATMSTQFLTLETLMFYMKAR